jgi:ABC-type glycerol-3-phosphate transport system substrate-binding protein
LGAALAPTIHSQSGPEGDDVRRREFILTAAGLGAAVGLAACGKSGGSTAQSSTTPGAAASSGEVTGQVKVTFQQFGNSKVQANFLNGWAKKFTAAHPKATVKLQPITASENDYYTKLQLSMRSPRAAAGARADLDQHGRPGAAAAAEAGHRPRRQLVVEQLAR